MLGTRSVKILAPFLAKYPLPLGQLLTRRGKSALAHATEILEKELAGIKDAGTWKSERVITSKQGARIRVEGTDTAKYPLPLGQLLTRRGKSALAHATEILEKELAGIKDAGTWKSERVITSKQGARIRVEGTDTDNFTYKILIYDYLVCGSAGWATPLQASRCTGRVTAQQLSAGYAPHRCKLRAVPGCVTASSPDTDTQPSALGLCPRYLVLGALAPPCLGLDTHGTSGPRCLRATVPQCFDALGALKPRRLGASVPSVFKHFPTSMASSLGAP
ncbi:UNVERIFIED_CONTAM: hypothetical protein FKN15_054696 [Acipenser sinensis]